ncbi:MAG: TraB/GumN family protein [Bacteroidaceae bacterium]|nr:TraB/GumN family protein [Bacteroidaceae bacterium]
MKRLTFTFLLTFIAFTAKAQTASNPGWLWTISGNGLEQKSYLFGTCHGDGISFTDEEIYSIHGLSEALDEAQTVFFESDPNVDGMSDKEKEELTQLYGRIYNPGPEYMMPEGVFYKPLYDSVAHFNEVNKFMSYEMKDMEYWKKTPGYWCIRLSMYAFTKVRMCRSVDLALIEETARRGKETGGLETTSSVMGMIMSMYTDTKYIDTLSMKEQAKIIYKLVHRMNNDSILQFLKLHEAYLENDTCKFNQFLGEFEEELTKWNEEALGNGMEDKKDYTSEHLLRERNELWVPVIKENIAKRPCMIAVGCRHLLSGNGLIAMLRREGYTVEPVMKKKD